MARAFRTIAIRSGLFASVFALGACSILPAVGPTVGEIDDALADNNPLQLKIVMLTPAVVDIVGSPPTPTPAAAILDAPATVGRIGVGDVLSISVFESGASLFSSGGSAAISGSGGTTNFTPPSGAAVANLPPLQVGPDGKIMMPYVGYITAAGITPFELQKKIEQGLKEKSLAPQVIVNVMHDLTNTVVVSGDVHTPGRLSLSPVPEHLLDILAIAGGTPTTPQSERVELTRGESRLTAVLSDVQPGGPLDPILSPGDQIRVFHQARTFSVFGSAYKVSDITFESPKQTLAQALADAMATNDNQSDPTGVYLFRFETPDIARTLGVAASDKPVPIIYRIDLLDPTSYVLLTEFQMRDKDLIYVANARSMRIQKFVNLVANLFAPAAATRNISQ